MSFIWPSLLFLLLIVPLLLWFYFRAQRQRRAFAMNYGSLGVAGSTTKAGARRHIPAFIFFLAITILIVSVARPQAKVSVPKLEGTVMLTFDVSGSMAADDLKPTRMEAAKAAAREFVNKQPSYVAIGVVAFSDAGLLVQPPTTDRAKTLDTISHLTPQRGTSLGNGMLVALNSIVVNAGDPPFLKTSDLANPSAPAPDSVPQGWYPSSAIILLSDGENNQSPDPAKVSDLAANLGVRIYTIGIGKPEGAVINIEGFSIQTQLDETMLKDISTNTGGTYYSAADQEQLSHIYSDLKPKLFIHAEDIEVTAIFAGVGVLFSLLAGALSLLWFGRVP